MAGVLLVPGWLAPKITEGQDPRPTISAADVAQLLDQMEAATTDAQRWSYVEKLAGDGTPDATAAGLIKTQLGAKQYSEMTLIAAWRALHARGDQNYAAGRLIDATTSFRSTEAQREASALLMQVCTTAHEGSLVKLLESVFDAEIKINVARALWFTCKETTNSLQALRDLLTSDMTSVRLAAALAYAETGHISEVEPTIAELAQEPSMRGRLARQLLIKMRLDRTLEAIYIGLGRDNPNATPSKIVDPDVTTRIAEDVLTMIKERAAVDTERLSDVSVLRAAADQMIRAIDPYSGFLVNTAEADRWKTFASTLGTGQPGAGLVVGQPFGSIRVNAVIEGSPAARAGIRPGDLITEIDGHEIHEKSLIEIDTLLHGAAGSQVTVKLIRPGWFVTRAYTLTREVVPAPTISTKMLPGKLAWLRVPMCIG
ncbi:MAG: S41 family peptidase, partial [Planctomycetota bacterium]